MTDVKPFLQEQLSQKEKMQQNPEDVDEFYNLLKQEALQVMQDEPELELLLKRTVLAPHVKTFEDVVMHTLWYRLLLPSVVSTDDDNDASGNEKYPISPKGLRKLILLCMKSDVKEKGWTIGEAIRQDAVAVIERDPAMDSILEVVLFAKGYMALCCHRVANRLWHMKRKFGALFIQSQTSAVFGVDIHPLAAIGKGVMMDHATGIVVGQTATIGDGCTILHDVTLGGTGKEEGDRHPKVGDHVLIGAGSLLLGNISVGESAKIGAGSVLLRDIPAHATAVGVPAKIIGRADESDPGEEIDNSLRRVSLLGRKPSSITTAASTLSYSSESEEVSSFGSSSNHSHHKMNEHQEKEVKIGQHQQLTRHDRKEFREPSRLTEGDEFCPFRGYAEVAKRGTPKGTVNILTFGAVLHTQCIPHCIIGLCFFELDHSGRGYVKMQTISKEGPEVISRNCGISLDTANALVQRVASMVDSTYSY